MNTPIEQQLACLLDRVHLAYEHSHIKRVGTEHGGPWFYSPMATKTRIKTPKRSATMAPTLDDLKSRVAEFNNTYRRPEFQPLEVSAAYDCSPEKGDPIVRCEGQWPDDYWPNAWSAGIYGILDEELQLLYVGKASLGSTLGSRLSSYFRHDQNRHCRPEPHHTWSGNPRYVVTVAVPEEMRFEAPALEEFLINKLNPPDNTAGANRNN